MTDLGVIFFVGASCLLLLGRLLTLGEPGEVFWWAWYDADVYWGTATGEEGT